MAKNIRDFNESEAKILLEEFLKKGDLHDSKITKEINKLSKLITNIEELNYAGRNLIDLHKLLNTSNKRRKEVADSLLDFVKHKEKIDLERQKFEEEKKQNDIKNNKTSSDENGDGGSETTLPDNYKEEIRKMIGED